MGTGILRMYDAVYDHKEQVLSVYIEVGESGREFRWEIDILPLAFILGLDIRESTEVVDYGDGRGEDYIITTYIEGVPIEYFFFTQEDVSKACQILYAKEN